MLVVGWAIGWEYWARTRIFMGLALANLLALVLLVQFFPAGTPPWGVASGTIPLWATLLVIVAVFSDHGQDLVARESGYPQRNFTLPVRTATLVGWPMALATTAPAVCWLIVSGLVLRPAGLPVPLLWPAAFLAAWIAWGQALLWCPFPLPGLRALVALPVLSGMVVAAVLGYAYDVAPALMLTVAAGLIPLGYGVAVVGVARARRGDVPVWHWPQVWHHLGAATPRPPFASAAAALYWVDWQRHGFMYLGLVGMSLAELLLALLFLPGSRQPALTAGVFVGTLVILPLVLAAATGVSLGNTNPSSKGDNYAMPAFVAARPITAAELLAVKYRVAIRAALFGGCLALLALLVLLPFYDVGVTLAGWTRRLIDMHGMRGAALLGFGVLALAALNVKAIIDQLWLGLTGRGWLIITISVAVPVALVALGSLAGWLVSYPETHETLFATVPWFVGVALALKLIAGMAVGIALLRRELVAPRTLLRFAGAWVAGAAVLMGLAFALVPAEICAPMVVGCAAVTLLLPMVRLGLGPLALDWNRHR